MKRLFWLSVGVALGVAATRRATRFARTWTPEGVAGQVAGLADLLGELADDVRSGMRERETELRRLMASAPGRPDSGGGYPGSDDPGGAEHMNATDDMKDGH